MKTIATEFNLTLQKQETNNSNQASRFVITRIFSTRVRFQLLASDEVLCMLHPGHVMTAADHCRWVGPYGNNAQHLQLLADLVLVLKKKKKV